jgi:outer membrane protein assembly factor BamB
MALATGAAAEDPDSATWTRFRGSEGRGRLAASPFRLPWSNDQVTKIALPGTGIGSPVVWGDRVFLMASEAEDATRYLVAVDLKNQQLAWTQRFSSTPHRLHQYSSYASSTPCVDGSGVVVAWGDPEHVWIKKFSLEGEEIWSRDFGRYVSQHGFGTSPILVDGMVILLDSQDAEELEQGVAPGEDRMLALDATSGESVWETSLPTRRVCYGVPAVRTAGGVRELVGATTGLGIFGMNLADGKVLWNHDCFRLRVCASMQVVGELAIASHGSLGGRDNLLVAYDMDKQEERFRIQRAAPYVPTPVATDDLLFLWSDAGIVSCVRLQDGSVCWSERIGGNFFSSPVILGDTLVNVSDAGEVTFLAAKEVFDRLGAIETGAGIRATIAVAQDHLLLRTENQLWVIHP